MLPRIITRGDHEAARLLAREGIRQLNILKNLMSFGNLKQDVRRVRFTNGSEIICKSIFGIDDVQIYVPKEVKKWETKVKCYIYVTISNYVTVWDLETGEAAEDVVGDNGKGIKFPCHKDAISNWLKGFTDRPTREILKDNPKNCRDYIDDNHKDIGDENRLEYADSLRDDYGFYYGIEPPVQYADTIPPEDNGTCDSFSSTKEESPCECDVINCDLEKCKDSFKCSSDYQYYYDCLSECYNCNRVFYQSGEMEYLKTYYNRSKHVYLGAFPCPVYIDLSTPSILHEYTTAANSAYEKPIDIEFDRTEFNCGSGVEYPDFWPLTRVERKGKSFTIRTVLGDLIIDDIPAEEWKGTNRLYEMMQQPILNDACFSAELADGVCKYAYNWEGILPLWRDYWQTPKIVDGPEHATESSYWAKAESRSTLDLQGSESNRTAISWCGSPPWDKSAEWYRVLVIFHMGGFHVNSCEWLQDCDGSPYYRPSQEHCDEINNDPGNCTCTLISNTGKLVKRFSAVQATIELENPKKYPKEMDVTKYERPEDFDVNSEKYECLCAFPGRSHGVPVDDEKGICFPYDGSYRIKSLEKAVKELINTCYVDGSDDKLLVYLYKRKIMREKVK